MMGAKCRGKRRGGVVESLRQDSGDGPHKFNGRENLGAPATKAVTNRKG